MEKMEISEKDSKMLEIIEKMVASGVSMGIKQGIEQARNEEKLRDKITFDIRLKNTKLLLKNYRKFKEFFNQATYSEKELETATVEEVIDKIYCQAYDDVTIVQSILASKKRTEIIMTHIEKMIRFYLVEAEHSKIDEKIRKANILNDLYIEGTKVPEMSLLAKKYNISLRQLHRDKNAATEELAVYMFRNRWIKENILIMAKNMSLTCQFQEYIILISKIVIK